MEFGSPEKNRDGITRISIQTEAFLKLEYISSESTEYPAPPIHFIEIQQYLKIIANNYEQYSKKWFGIPVDSVLFLQRLTHTWDTTNYKSAWIGRVYQEWCPEQLLITGRGFTIIWKLVKNIYKDTWSNNSVSGTSIREIDSEQMPLDSTNAIVSLNTTLRSRALRKVREARLIAAVSKARADALTKRYYEKYGNMENNDSNSVLSSESDEN
jgi:hypothetical protein